MKICVLGGSGQVGSRVIARALARGHEVTAPLRDPSRLPAGLGAQVRTPQLDFGSEAAIAAVVAGHDAVVNAAGYITQPDYVPLVTRVIGAVGTGLGRGGRFWMMAGAALLDVPGTAQMTLSLPKIPALFEAHLKTYRAVRATALDWSVLCPGPMIAAPDGQPTPGLILSREVWPVPRWRWTGRLPPVVTSLNFARSVPRMTISYEDAAEVIVSHLDPDCAFSRSRVGIALPDGQVRHKPVA